jgi:hypothetical protein
VHCQTRVLYHIPVWVLRNYLEDLGGRVSSDDCITGDGWEARLFQVDQTPETNPGETDDQKCIRLEWRGNEQAFQTVWPLLEQKLLEDKI